VESILAVVILGFFVFVGLITRNFGDDDDSHRLTCECENVCEAVFRYMFDSFRTEEPHAGSYFIEIARRNPSHMFLSRFVDISPRVLQGSLYGKNGGSKFQVDYMEWLDNDTVSVTAALKYRAEPNEQFIELVRDNGEWKVS